MLGFLFGVLVGLYIGYVWGRYYGRPINVVDQSNSIADGDIVGRDKTKDDQ